MRRPSARRPSLCARRDARKKFRANALEWTVLIVVGVAAPCASFQFGQLIGHKLFPEQQYNDAHATCNANPKDQIFVRSASDPFSAIQPDATPAPARMWKERRAKKKKASETAADISDVKRRAAKKWLRGVTGCLGLQC